MKRFTILVIILFAELTTAQDLPPIRALRTIMEVEYVAKHYQLGTGMIGLGDINSDGKPDFAVSAGAINKTFIYYGGKGVLDDEVDIIIEGGGAMEKGDLNGDGVMDLVIYMKADSSSSWLARLAVYLGRKDSVIKIDTVPSLIIKEEISESHYGVGEAFTIGDINNDGYDDLIVGASDFNGLRGKVYFYYGKPNISGTPDTSAEGEKTDSVYSSYGFSIHTADLNGDRIKDLIIGSDKRCLINSMWISDATIDIFYGRNDWSFNKNKYNKRLDKNNTGFEYLWTAKLVDINNDGLSDVSYAKGDSAYFFLGSRDSVSSQPGMIISNPDTNFYSAFVNPCCFNIGDINNDGKDDFAFRASPGGYSECLIVYLGGTKPQPVAGRCKGFLAGGNPFSPIVSFDDVNGDGVNDFGTCAPTNPLGGPYDGYFVILSGDSTFVTSVNKESSIPTESHLLQNYPNPFNPETTIEYTLNQRANIKLYIYDMLGKEIIKLTDKEEEVGRHTVQWNGKSNSGKSVASGTYFYRIIIDGVKQETKKLLLLR